MTHICVLYHPIMSDKVCLMKRNSISIVWVFTEKRKEKKFIINFFPTICSTQKKISFQWVRRKINVFCNNSYYILLHIVNGSHPGFREWAFILFLWFDKSIPYFLYCISFFYFFFNIMISDWIKVSKNNLQYFRRFIYSVTKLMEDFFKQRND